MTEKKFYRSDAPFDLEGGGQIQNLTIAYHTYGTINEKKDNIIWVFHALTASSDVMDWWPGLFGKDCLYNAADYFIICANILGSPYGSSKPDSLDFPLFSARDIVKSQFLLAADLGIKRIHTCIGGSFGGNQAVEFAYGFEGTIKHLILVASCAKESPWGIAIHEGQRLALKADPSFGSLEGGKAGMKAARAFAMISYRSAQAFDIKQTDEEEKLDDFRAASYIQYQGDKFVKRFNALSYYYLSKCLDTHDLGRDRGGLAKALAQIKVPTLVVSIKSDLLIPTHQQAILDRHLPNATFVKIDSDYGHDGFLVEVKQIDQKIRAFYHTNQS